MSEDYFKAHDDSMREVTKAWGKTFDPQIPRQSFYSEPILKFIAYPVEPAQPPVVCSGKPCPNTLRDVSRGYAAIGLDNPKSAVNVGSVMRAALVYDAALVVVSGGRVGKLLSNPTDTMKAWKHLPVFSPEDILTAIPHDCVPVAVDLVPGARSLYNYAHPERAFYIFGGEDQTLGKRIISKCRDVVMIPTERCMNLAACVNVVLYDRAQKAARKGNGI